MRRLPIILTIALFATAMPAEATAVETGWISVTPALARPENVHSVYLDDVTAVSSSDIWTVGFGWGDGPHNLIAHWDGAGWRQVAAPSSPNFEYVLMGVDAVATRDVWAVGYTMPPLWNIPFTAVVAHYDGTAWSFAPAPPPPPPNSYKLFDVDMLSATDGWAVGQRTGSPLDGMETWQPLVMRWQNGRWVTVSMPYIDGGQVTLESVHALAHNDVWAVGNQGGSALVLHFDGTRWTRVGVPGGEGDDTLRAVTAVSAGDVWAVGTTCVWLEVNASCLPLVIHLSSGVWRVVPTTGDGGTHLVGVVARSANDVWVVGYDGPLGGQETNHVEHWDGVRFTTVPSNTPAFTPQGGLASALEAVTRIPGTAELWAVGWQDSDPQVIRHG